MHLPERRRKRRDRRGNLGLLELDEETIQEPRWPALCGLRGDVYALDGVVLELLHARRLCPVCSSRSKGPQRALVERVERRAA